MQRKKKANGLLISGLISALASLAIVAVAPSFAHHNDDHAQGGGNDSATSSEDQGSKNTPGNDRKEGYEDNSTTPQEPNHGKGSDHDGDADSDPNTAYEDDHTTADAGDNAHPSGKDRSVENGGSGNQGKSESNPDDSKGPMRYEGVQGDDKPGGPGGTDLADQDGNNGCGNDDDFNDDNNGWCGRPTKTKPADVSKPVCDADATMPGTQKCDKPEEVLGGVITKPCDKDNNMANGIQACDKPNEVMPELEVNPSTPEDTVLGEQIEKDKAAARPEGPKVLGLQLSPALNAPVKVAGAVLPFTGGDVLVFLVLALALFASGMLIMRSTKKSTQS
jgi:hypothetical protein